MTKWEYLELMVDQKGAIISSLGPPSDHKFERNVFRRLYRKPRLLGLNLLGQDGWEVVGITAYEFPPDDGASPAYKGAIIISVDHDFVTKNRAGCCRSCPSGAR